MNMKNKAEINQYCLRTKMALHLFKTCYSIYMLAWVKTKHATRAGDQCLTAV